MRGCLRDSFFFFYLMKIIFLGTPDFAVASLEAILNSGYQVVAVVTAPDKPGGRGMALQQSAVKLKALEKGIPVLQPVKLKDQAFIDELKKYEADIQVVVAFRMLPEIIWNMPPMGTVNVHASLLPQYRGAAPIHWSIINGETETGVTTFRLKHEIDTGNILLQRKLSIGPSENVGSLYDRLMHAGAELLVETLEGIQLGTLKEKEQNSSGIHLRHAPKITKEICLIDWTKTAKEIHQLVRGLSPTPGAFTHLQGKILKIFEMDFSDQETNQVPGTIQTDHKSFLRIVCGKGFAEIRELQVEGKKRMRVEEFLRGIKLIDQEKVG